MFEITKSVEREPFWKRYRSLTLGRPAVEVQAYSAVYPWIEFDGIYYHRSLETALRLMINKERIPEFLYKDADMINCIHVSIVHGEQLRYCNLGMKAPENSNYTRMLALKAHRQIAVLGNVPINCRHWNNTRIYTNQYNLGGDYVISEQECVALSQEMPLVCRLANIVDETYDMTGVDWNNVWVWEV